MGINKNEETSNLKNKIDISVGSKKTSSNIFQMPKGRSDRIPRLKVQRPITQPATNNGYLTPQRIIKKHNCAIPDVELSTPSSFKKPKSYLKRKSISLEAINNNSKIWTPKNIHSKEQGDASKTLSRPIIDHKYIFTFSNSKKESELAKKVCKMFILHAWRKRRTQAAELKNRSQKLDNVVQNLNIQVVVLANLLKSEEQRLNAAVSDSDQLKDRLEAEISENTSLKKSLSQLEFEKSALEETAKKLETDRSILKNELDVANVVINHSREIYAETQRELADSREKEGEMLTKLGETEASLRDVISCLEEERKKSADLQFLVTKLIVNNQNLEKEKKHKEKEVNEYKIEIKKRDVEVNNLQNARKVQNENIVNLTKDVAVARNKIIEQEHTIRSLEEIVSQYESVKEERDLSMLTMRNHVVFEGIKIFAKLLFPSQPLKPL